MLERLRLQQTARPVDVIQHWTDKEYIDMDPPYQRGEVWGQVRQQNLIKSLLTGIPVPSIIINDRFEAGWGQHIAVIDGKQRLTTILKFLTSRLPVPGEWFDTYNDVFFADLPKPQQRRFCNTPIQFCEAVLTSMEAEQELFELVNYGGVPQGQSDL